MYLQMVLDNIHALSLVANSRMHENRDFGTFVKRIYPRLADRTFDVGLEEWPDEVYMNVR